MGLPVPAPVQEHPVSAGPEPAALPEVGQSGGHDKSELGTATGRPLPMRLFHLSIAYLTLLFGVVAITALLPWGRW